MLKTNGQDRRAITLNMRSSIKYSQHTLSQTVLQVWM